MSALCSRLSQRPTGWRCAGRREIEPPGATGELETMENVVLTPHIGSFTREAQTRTVDAVAADIERSCAGHRRSTS